MLSLLLFIFFITCSYIAERYLSLRRNIKIAKAVQLPYVVVPLYTATPLWYFCYGFVLPALKKLPATLTFPWLDFLDPYWSWKLHHEPFARLRSDTIIVVAPGGIIFCTCDPNIIIEVAGRRWDFCKPVESYVFLDLLGPSLITREGKSWRIHQKLLAPAFSEGNAKLVWEESLVQAEAMLRSWNDEQRAGAKSIPAIREDTMILPFHVINKAGFGVHLPWAKGMEAGSHERSVDRISHGHQMSYRQALQTAITHLFHILIFPDWLLRIVPIGYTKLLHTAHHESVRYLKELMVEKEDELKNEGNISNRKSGVDIMGALVSAKVNHQYASTTAEESKALEDEEVLSEEAILSNVFVLLIAGHETTATVLLIAMIELAISIDWQRRLQKDLDKIFGNRSPSSWDIYTDVEKMFDGSMGAIINEVLRLYPPANIIPKGTRPNEPQTITSGSCSFTVPGNTAFQFVANSTHRNPKYWPSGPAPPGKLNDLDEFRPQRWLAEKPVQQLADRSYPTPAAATYDNDKQSGATTPDGVLSVDTSAALFRPFPGAYIPFSTGHRQCIGRRFAQVELFAVLAVLFKSYSLELDVGEFADDEAVGAMSAGEKKNVWKQAAKRMTGVLREGMRHHLTMQLKKGKVALRLVLRGKERFM